MTKRPLIALAALAALVTVAVTALLVTRTRPPAGWRIYSNNTIGVEFWYPSEMELSVSEDQYDEATASEFGYAAGTRSVIATLEGAPGRRLQLSFNGGPFGMEEAYVIRRESIAVDDTAAAKTVWQDYPSELPLGATETPAHVSVIYEFVAHTGSIRWFGSCLASDSGAEGVFDAIVASFRSNP